MENNLENKLSMYQKVQGFLTLNASSMTSLPIVATLKTQLDIKRFVILHIKKSLRFFLKLFLFYWKGCKD